MSRYENRQDLANKISWEGGLEEALSYGIDASDLPEGDEELRAAWTPMQAAWDAYDDLAEKVRNMLPDA